MPWGLGLRFVGSAAKGGYSGANRKRSGPRIAVSARRVAVTRATPRAHRTWQVRAYQCRQKSVLIDGDPVDSYEYVTLLQLVRVVRWPPQHHVIDRAAAVAGRQRAGVCVWDSACVHEAMSNGCLEGYEHRVYKRL